MIRNCRRMKSNSVEHEVQVSSDGMTVWVHSSDVGLNRTNSALARIERSGTASISNEALLTFKQGLGRLIRRTGVTDRRIWILDGRIFGSWNRMPQLTGAARRLLREYVHQHTF